VFGQVEQLEAEQAELRAHRAEFITATATAPTPVDPADLVQMDVDRQRAVFETVLGGVVIAPAGRRGEPWTRDRITFAWKGSRP